MHVLMEKKQRKIQKKKYKPQKQWIVFICMYIFIIYVNILFIIYVDILSLIYCLCY